MKKLYFIAVLTLLLASCGSKSVQTENEKPITDSLALFVMHDILDSTLSIEDIKVEYRQLLDRIYTDASSNPDEYLRIGAKSFAIDLLGLTLEGPHATHEDREFTIDSLLSRFTDIRDCWYADSISCLDDSTQYCCLYQDMICSSSNGLKMVSIVVCIYDSTNSFACVTFPEDVAGSPYIAFTDEDFNVAGRKDVFTSNDAYESEREEDGTLSLYFDETFFPQMLSHEGIIAGYASNDEKLSEEEQTIIILGGLNHFHSKYKKIIEFLSNK